jgi:hypothetical protein
MYFAVQDWAELQKAHDRFVQVSGNPNLNVLFVAEAKHSPPQSVRGGGVGFAESDHRRHRRAWLMRQPLASRVGEGRTANASNVANPKRCLRPAQCSVACVLHSVLGIIQCRERPCSGNRAIKNPRSSRLSTLQHTRFHE